MKLLRNTTCFLILAVLLLKGPCMQAQLNVNGNLTAGYVNNALGFDSHALGYGNYVAGGNSIALGFMNYIPTSGGISLAFGYYNQATASNSLSLGTSSIASGNYSAAFGYYNQATGSNSLSLGTSSIASGNYSVAIGSTSTASGNTSTAVGANLTSSAMFSMALGTGVVANAYAMVAVGSYNSPPATPNPTAWIGTDPLFVVGNGSSATAKSNALTILKNGTVLSSGSVGIGTTSPQAQLDVNGGVRVGGSLVISGSGSLVLPDGTVLTGSNSFGGTLASGTALSISGTIPARQVSGLSAVAISGSYASLTGLPVIPTNNNQLVNGAGYITSGGTSSYALVSGVANSINGTIPSSQVSGLAQVATAGAFDALVSKPTTLSGYGITDPVLLASGTYADPVWLASLAYSKVVGAPTKISSFTNDMGYITSGDITVSGTVANMTLSGTTKVPGSFIVTGTNVNGVIVSGSNQVLLIPQQGDLSMGEFINGTQPQ